MSVELKTNYLGLELKHPLIVGASPLVDQLPKIRELEDAGAAAIVMHSLFEEQITSNEEGIDAHIHSHEETYAEATSYFPGDVDFALGPDTYLERIAEIKEIVSVPVIGSLNGRTPTGWTSFAKDIESAGADALELNLYFQPTDSEISSEELEAHAASTVESVCQKVSIPVAVKLSPYFSSLPHFVRRLEKAGAKAVVLFNRFYQPDIDIVNLETVPALRLSDSSELLLRLRWLAILRDRFSVDLSCSGGVHTSDDAIKAIMAGADTVQMVSSLLQKGPSHLATVLEKMTLWLGEFDYKSIADARGSMSHRNTPNPEAVERANYLKILQSWSS
ncbi:dihydroorotate dehydrogenase-like protein [Puniceicoccus vermicola]|uniref:Dihydroorotate dehydrogenase-like protein n=1 Tax=Puniceicoccus vermicola TaxID=388746 RepID=A0A7X1AWN3_9BACT|nr:dihydroorotate dehydrogenase-like protein [Puniceicoccus vermicola]MBC2601375.1 dihydroorotate dehydrogenase-like protein [Puniceicoccus vermicola]